MFRDILNGVFGGITTPPGLIDPKNYEEKPPYALYAFSGIALIIVAIVFVKLIKK